MGFENLFEPTRLLTYFLIIMRMGGIFFTAPVFSGSALNNQVRIIITLIISMLILPVVTPVTVTDPNVLWLTVSVAKEILIGVCIGGMTSLLFSALQMGGYLVDYQMGFSMVSVMDPTSNASISYSGQVYNILGTLIYLAINGHHIFLRAVAQSFNYMPAGDFRFNSEGLMFILSTFVKIFIVAIQITAPVFIALMVTNVIMGILARLVPQMNIMVVGFPVKITVGALMLIASMQLFYIAYEKIIFEYFRQIKRFFEINGLIN
ncbi:MAG: flagellar biosynthetic protein FliR [Mucispirillum sp.]|nr:flagellar biosynthetic protein FliR [Mucispirillum sp.]